MTQGKGKKSTQINQSRHRSWQVLKKQLENWSLQTQGGGKNPYTGVRKIPIQRQGTMQRALGSGFCLPRQGEENREKSCHILHPVPPTPLTAGLNGLQQLSVWQEKDVAKGISLQRTSCSGLTAGRRSCGKVCCLKRPPRRIGATGKDMLFQESLLHWR